MGRSSYTERREGSPSRSEVPTILRPGKYFHPENISQRPKPLPSKGLRTHERISYHLARHRKPLYINGLRAWFEPAGMAPRMARPLLRPPLAPPLLGPPSAWELPGWRASSLPPLFHPRPQGWNDVSPWGARAYERLPAFHPWSRNSREYGQPAQGARQAPPFPTLTNSLSKGGRVEESRGKRAPWARDGRFRASTLGTGRVEG